MYLAGFLLALLGSVEILLPFFDVVFRVQNVLLYPVNHLSLKPIDEEYSEIPVRRRLGGEWGKQEMAGSGARRLRRSTGQGNSEERLGQLG